MRVTIDSSSRIPPYEQVRATLAAQITGRSLAVGSKLPTVRKLAADLGIAANTVARAYRELEEAGLIETRGRGGTFVSAAGDKSRERTFTAAAKYAAAVRALGVSESEALDIVTAAIRDAEITDA